MSRKNVLAISGLCLLASGVAISVATWGGSGPPDVHPNVAGVGSGSVLEGVSLAPNADAARKAPLAPTAAPAPDTTPPRAPRVVARALGKIESASEEIGVASDITSRIVQILVEEGDSVAEGQPLVQLDDTIERAGVAAAEAAVRVARARKAKLDAGARVEEIRRAEAVLAEAEARSTIARDRAGRARKLEESGAGSTDETDALRQEAEARSAQVLAAREDLAIMRNYARPEDLEAAAAELEMAERELAARQVALEKTILRSPIEGTVIRRHRRVGEAVSSFQVEPVVSVADLSRLRVRAEVDEIDIAKVREGQEAVATCDSFPEVTLRGRVIRLGKSMGRRTIRGSDPNEREDVRVREVLVELEGAPDLPLGLRVIAGFME